MYLAEIKMDFGEFDMMLFLFLKLEKKVVKTWKKSKGFGEGNCLKNISLYIYFLKFLSRFHFHFHFVSFSFKEYSSMEIFSHFF